MRWLVFCVLSALALGLSGCVSQPPPRVYPALYDELLTLSKEDSTVPVAELVDDYLEQELGSEKLLQLIDYEQQTLALRDHPLRLGSTASAVTQRCYPSLVGHLALAEFYENLNHEYAEVHREWIARITEYMTHDRDGSYDRPYRAITFPQALALLLQQDEQVIGSVYVGNEAHPVLLRLTVRRVDREAEYVHFDLTPSHSILKDEYQGADPESVVGEKLRGVVVGLLSTQNDPAAQLSLGVALARQSNYPAARRLLGQALRAENSLANLALAQLYIANGMNSNNDTTRKRSFERARGYYEAAIESGHDQALFDLATLYIRDLFGNDDRVRARAIDLLDQSATLGSIDSTILLANLLITGELGVNDYARAQELLSRAASKGNSDARIILVRLLQNPKSGLELTEQAYDWLRATADDEDDANAMVALGNCYAKGCLSSPNYRKARRWYRRAVNAEPENANVINDVAWTLVVSNRERLRSPRYALRIIEEIMLNDAEARESPAYIDTWAAAYAATGNFERALELQREALDRVMNSPTRSEAELKAIQDHLDSFSNEKVVIEEVP